LKAAETEIWDEIEDNNPGVGVIGNGGLGRGDLVEPPTAHQLDLRRETCLMGVWGGVKTRAYILRDSDDTIRAPVNPARRCTGLP